jgi:hypothetical protein
MAERVTQAVVETVTKSDLAITTQVILEAITSNSSVRSTQVILEAVTRETKGFSQAIWVGLD